MRQATVGSNFPFIRNGSQGKRMAMSIIGMDYGQKDNIFL
jgi:hypothetical protein